MLYLVSVFQLFIDRRYKMINYDVLYRQLANTGLGAWQDILPEAIDKAMAGRGHGNYPRWLEALEKLPDINPTLIDLNQATINIGSRADCTESQHLQLEQSLRSFHPWRKGPFNIFGINIETEWRSDLKWDRVQPHISSLEDKVVLDVGCGSGYHCWRMEAEGARLVIGIEPTLSYVMQYQAIQHYIQSTRTFVLPFSTDTMPEITMAFDTVFSMGVLYHRRSPIDHLTQLWQWLKPGGQLVLETLVIEGEQNQALTPENRYAKMRNVWFIPSCDTLSRWLRRCSFENTQCVDVNQTTSVEQHTTDWMQFESLKDFLDPNDSSKTIEGYPAPRRAIFIANKPS